MLPRSRSCHLFGTMFVYGRFGSINKKWGRFKGQRRKVINLWWLTYIWDRQLAGQKSVQVLTYLSKYLPVQVLISSRMKTNSRSFSNITEASVDLGKSKYVWAALLQWDKYLNVNNRSGINARKGWFCIPFWERKISKKKDSCEFKPSL